MDTPLYSAVDLGNAISFGPYKKGFKLEVPLSFQTPRMYGPYINIIIFMVVKTFTMFVTGTSPLVSASLPLTSVTDGTSTFPSRATPSLWNSCAEWMNM